MYISFLITCNIFNTFYANPSLEVHGVLLDLSDALDKAWHHSLFHKLKSKKTEENLIKGMEENLNNRHH